MSDTLIVFGSAFGIMFILALIYTGYVCVRRIERTNRKQYQEHIDNLTNELFPPSISDLQESTLQESTLQESTLPEATAQEADAQYEEAKRKMVADIRTYFNQRKMDAALARMPGPDELAPVNPYHTKDTRPSPPSIQMLME